MAEQGTFGRVPFCGGRASFRLGCRERDARSVNQQASLLSRPGDPVQSLTANPDRGQVTFVSGTGHDNPEIGAELSVIRGVAERCFMQKRVTVCVYVCVCFHTHTQAHTTRLGGHYSAEAGRGGDSAGPGSSPEASTHTPLC